MFYLHHSQRSRKSENDIILVCSAAQHGVGHLIKRKFELAIENAKHHFTLGWLKAHVVLVRQPEKSDYTSSPLSRPHHQFKAASSVSLGKATVTLPTYSTLMKHAYAIRTLSLSYLEPVMPQLLHCHHASFPSTLKSEFASISLPGSIVQRRKHLNECWDFANFILRPILSPNRTASISHACPIALYHRFLSDAAGVWVGACFCKPHTPPSSVPASFSGYFSHASPPLY